MRNFDADTFGSPTSNSSIAIDVNPVLRLVYMWMGLGLLVTAVVAFITTNTPALFEIAMNQTTLIVASLGSLALVFALSMGINKLSPTIAALMFFVYAALLGFTTMTIVLAVYPSGSIAAAFFTTSGVFGAMTVIGFTTSMDLTKFRTYFVMGLVGLLIAMIVNMFLNSGPFDMLISIAGVILFTGLTAYDTQKIKKMAADPALQTQSDLTMKVSIMGALILYLDFVNLFLMLLRLFSSRD